MQVPNLERGAKGTPVWIVAACSGALACSSLLDAPGSSFKREQDGDGSGGSPDAEEAGSGGSPPAPEEAGPKDDPEAGTDAEAGRTDTGASTDAEAGTTDTDASTDAEAGTTDADAPDPIPAGVVELTGSPPVADAWFGYGIAAARDSLLVSAPFEVVDGFYRAGAAYLFERRAGNWAGTPLARRMVHARDGNLDAELLPDEISLFPNWTSMSLAVDDRVAIVSYCAEDGGRGSPTPDSGVVYVYDRTNLAATPLALRSPAGRAQELFGLRVALSPSWLAVSAPGPGSLHDGVEGAGAVYLYRRNGSAFEAPRVVTAPNAGEGDGFGIGLDLDDEFLVIGAPAEDGDGSDPANDDLPGSGAVYVFRLSESPPIPVEGGLGEPTYLKGRAPAEGVLFGASVSILGDDIAVGAMGGGCESGDAAGATGAVETFRRGDAGWSPDRCLWSPLAGPSTLYAWSVELLTDQVLVSAPWASARDAKGHALDVSGVVYRFGATELPPLVAPKPRAGAVLGAGLAVGDDFLAVGAPLDSRRAPTGPTDSSGVVYVYALDRLR